jgi:hypothetical protein
MSGSLNDVLKQPRCCWLELVAPAVLAGTSLGIGPVGPSQLSTGARPPRPSMVIRSLASLVFAAVLLAPLAHGQVVGTSCLRYEPDTIHVSGVLRRHTYPGPPNYESVRRGDAAETGFYLHLAHPVCARGRPAGDGEPDAAATRRDSVRVIQLVLDSTGYSRLRRSLGRRVTLRGTLFSSHTGHHHAPLLLTPLRPAVARTAK